MKKKVLMVLLAATLSVSMIAGCGSKGDNNTDTTKTESKQDSDQEAAPQQLGVLYMEPLSACVLYIR